MVLGLAVMGFAELFIDPVAMSQITRIEIPGVTGVLTGIISCSRGHRQLSGRRYRRPDLAGVIRRRRVMNLH
ncbi:hypothetical protein MJ561_09265 [Klebsiella pneumoniae]|nr:hypothetical protein MJ561_09265 [Klebsiella pneumoniae]